MLGAALLALAAAPAPRPIDAAELEAHVRFLSSDLLEGRGPGTRGDLLTQAYLQAQFTALGLEPAGADGGWLQPVELVGVEGHPTTLALSGARGALTLEAGGEFIAFSGQQGGRSRLDAAELVFVGYGITAPEYQWDDFKGAQLAGKVLVVLNNDPEDDPALFAGRTRLWYGRWDYKFEQARRVGAAGVLLIHTTPSAGYPWQVVQASWSGPQFELPAATPSPLQVKGWLTELATRKLFALAGRDLDEARAAAGRRGFKALPLGVTLSTSFTSAVARKTTANVLALLRGADPGRAAEVVVYSAHHDHLGLKAGAAPGEDVVYNGAVDNASGVAALLAIARYLRALPRPPARSVLFTALAAEEQGLLGSQYLMEHPPVAPGRMAANLNLDGLNVWGRTRDVSVIGLGRSSLDAKLLALAKAQGRVVKPDALADRGFFYRSDQFNFARRGVPSAYFSSGQDFVGRPEGWGREQRERWESTHYHQPSDELRGDWDLSGALEDVRLYVELGLAVAEDPALPTWTRGDEFEEARRRALQAVGRQ